MKVIFSLILICLTANGWSQTFTQDYLEFSEPKWEKNDSAMNSMLEESMKLAKEKLGADVEIKIHNQESSKSKTFKFISRIESIFNLNLVAVDSLHKFIIVTESYTTPDFSSNVFRIGFACYGSEYFEYEENIYEELNVATSQRFKSEELNYLSARELVHHLVVTNQIEKLVKYARAESKLELENPPDYEYEIFIYNSKNSNPFQRIYLHESIVELFDR